MGSQPGTIVLNGEVAFRLLAWKKRNTLNLEFASFLSSSQDCWVVQMSAAHVGKPG